MPTVLALLVRLPVAVTSRRLPAPKRSTLWKLPVLVAPLIAMFDPSNTMKVPLRLLVPEKVRVLPAARPLTLT